MNTNNNKKVWMNSKLERSPKQWYNYFGTFFYERYIYLYGKNQTN